MRHFLAVSDCKHHLHIIPDGEDDNNHTPSADCACEPMSAQAFEEDDDLEMVEITLYTHRRMH